MQAHCICELGLSPYLSANLQRGFQTAAANVQFPVQPVELWYKFNATIHISVEQAIPLSATHCLPVSDAMLLQGRHNQQYTVCWGRLKNLEQ